MTPVSTDVTGFVSELAAIKFDNVFNPYSDFCEENDLPDAAAIRRNNLTRVLTAAMAQGVESIWVARDLGYRGGRRTGLAMTDDAHILAHAQLLGSDPLDRATRGPIVAERTASVIWDALIEIKKPIFLWNVFPLHPHGPADEMSNRLHTRREREACRPLLDWLITNLKPKHVVAIGRDAQVALADSDFEEEVVGVRHPSYGGQREFTESIQRLYGYDAQHPDLFSDLRHG